MLIPEKIKKRYGDYLCRRCINRLYSLNLDTEDCLYGFYYKCRECKQDRHIVVGFTAKGKWKTLLKQKEFVPPMCGFF